MGHETETSWILLCVITFFITPYDDNEIWFSYVRWYGGNQIC